jgi:choline monooxygenase
LFLSDTHLPQLLPTTAYTDREWFDREKRRFLLPAWHLAATTDEIRRPGDFVTTTILEHPLIIHNADGQPRCFINSCAHRFAQLTHERSGNQCRLQCQYHGWEYDHDGATRRIPDAPAFKPLEKGQLGLVQLNTATCGKLIFVQLQPIGDSLTSFLGPLHGLIAEACASEHRQICSWSRVVDANWKLVVENTLESYHVSEIHRRTLGVMPEEPICHHQLRNQSSSFTAPGGVPGMVGFLQRQILSSLGKTPLRQYEHHLVLPTFSLSVMDDLVVTWTCEPIDPQRTRLTLRGFSVQSAKYAPVRNRLLTYIAKNHLAFWNRVWAEDVNLYPAVQAGVNSPRQPGCGLLSRREERVHHFQKWIAAQVAAPGIGIDSQHATGRPTNCETA